MLCRLYAQACRRFRRDGLTLSAAAHVRARDGKPWARNRIDGAWQLFFGIEQHCQSCFQHETRNHQPKAP